MERGRIHAQTKNREDHRTVLIVHKTSAAKVEREAKMEKYLQQFSLIMDIVLKIKGKYFRFTRISLPVVKWSKAINRQFSEEEIQALRSQMKKMPISLIIREIQIKTALRFHFMFLSLAKVTKKEYGKCWKIYRKIGTLMHHVSRAVLGLAILESNWELCPKS